MCTYVLDFDGVIANSTKEVFIISILTQKYFLKKEFISSINPEEIEKELKESNEIKNDFYQYRKYIRWPREYFFVLKHLFSNQIIKHKLLQTDFDNFSKSLPYEAMEFENLFFSIRRHLRTYFYNYWIALFEPYQEVISSLKKHALKDKIYILTGRDKDSVLSVIHNEGINIPNENILDLHQFSKKSKGLEFILSKENVSPKKLHFIDDNITHLEEVSKIVSHLFWAKWGYICEEHELFPFTKYVVPLEINTIEDFFKIK